MGVIFLSFLVLAVALHSVHSFRLHPGSKVTLTKALTQSSVSKLYGVRRFTKEELGEDTIDDMGGEDGSKVSKKKFKLEPETVFFEGPPSPTEILFPAISILTVIGIVPFISAVSRQFWVRYKFTSRRISIQSGFQGKERTEIIYPDIAEIKFVYRAFGAAGDMVLSLRDGAKVELRHVPKFNEVYQYILSRVDEDCRNKSMKPVASS